MGNTSVRGNRQTAMNSLEATPGTCGCGKRVLRAEREDGAIVTVDIAETDAAGELRALMAGISTYGLSWRQHRMVLELRTARDIKLHPAGYRADRIVLTHRCKEMHR